MVTTEYLNLGCLSTLEQANTRRLTLELVVVHVAQLMPSSQLTKDTHHDTPTQVCTRTQFLRLSGPHVLCASLASGPRACLCDNLPLKLSRGTWATRPHQRLLPRFESC